MVATNAGLLHTRPRSEEGEEESSGMGVPRKNWLREARRRLFRSPPAKETIVLHILHNNTTAASRSFHSDATTKKTATKKVSPEFSVSLRREQLASIHIQACFRGHLARRAYRALRSLVRIQAIVRGAGVRRQARIALQCMHALARLQVTIRARQLLLQ